MLATSNSVLHTGTSDFSGIISNLAVSAGVALVSYVVDIRLSGIFCFPGLSAELSTLETRKDDIQFKLLWGPFPVSRIALPPSSTSEGIQAPTYQYQDSCKLFGLTGLCSFVILAIASCVVVLNTSTQSLLPVDISSTSNEPSSQNLSSQRRNTTSTNTSTDSERTPPHNRSSEGTTWVAKELKLRTNIFTEGGSPPPPPPPSPPSAQDENAGSDKSCLDWISISLLLPIVLLLLRRLWAGSRIVNKEISQSDNDEPLPANVLTHLGIMDQVLVSEETCLNVIPWNHSSPQTPGSLPHIVDGPLFPFDQSMTFAPLTARSTWRFCADFATFVLSCAFSCCAFLLYFSMGLDEEEGIHPRRRQQDAPILNQVQDVVNESWQNVDREDVNEELPGESSMLRIIMDDSSKALTPMSHVENDESSSVCRHVSGGKCASDFVKFIKMSASAFGVVSVASTPSRANLNPMAKTFVPKHSRSLGSVGSPIASTPSPTIPLSI
ncbi:hypothetical protein CPB84DRAFT_1791113 [Gymnopilus junonius]|uniref:Transmembrane protein n=1 Tax=Gymnopilus junonius TaxID=109634 RepID=A0A9P5TJ20_GYMJU|nr:hypothetical protein CPB84DRAFT_1791113 [Gymnopilus junonius]